MKKIILFTCTLLLIKIFSFAQNVGIGINNPSRAKLELNGAVGGTSAIFGGESSGISLQRNWPGIGFNQYYDGFSRYIANGYAAVQYIDPNNGYMAFDMFGNGVANATAAFSGRAMTITNDGRVAIGTAVHPPATLFVARGSSPEGTAAFQGTTYRSHFNFGIDENTHIRAGKNNGTVFINDIATGGKVVMTGPVGINSLFPDYALEIRQVLNNKGLLIVDNATFHNWGFRVFGNDGDLMLYFNGLQRGRFFTDGHYSQISDKRLKTNITPLPSLLDKVMQLEPVSYEMIHQNPSNKKSIGFLAQDVKKIFPELADVRQDTTSGYKDINDLHSLNYNGFGIVAIKAIQEQQAAIESLKMQVEALNAEIQMLKGKQLITTLHQKLQKNDPVITIQKPRE
jgi:hypothetical protein